MFQWPNPNMPPKAKMVEIAQLRYLSEAIFIVNSKKIAKIVPKNETVHITQIAEAIDCHEHNLYRIMSYLASFGIFEEKEGKHFSGNDLSDCMDEKSPNSCHMILSAFGNQKWKEAIINLEKALEKNNERTPFQLVTGSTFYDYLKGDKEMQRNFDLGVGENTEVFQSKIPSIYDFSKFTTVVDIAGGAGGFAKAILLKNLNVRVSIFESPSVIHNIKPELFNEEPFKSRFTAVAGDFMESINVTADIFTIAMTLHCFEDARLNVILKNIHGAMKKTPGSKLLIVETDYEAGFSLNKPSGARTVSFSFFFLSSPNPPLFSYTRWI